MSVVVKADAFWIWPDGPMEDLVAVLKKYSKNGRPGRDIETPANNIIYRLTGATWQQAGGVFSGTVFRRRGSNLSSSVGTGGIRPLPLPNGDDLGEPMCFAFFPGLQAGLIHFNFHGPRHSVLSRFFTALGHQKAVHIDPILRQDVQERLDGARIIREVEFGLAVPPDARTRLAQDRSTEAAINLVRQFEGYRVKISVGMSHQRGSLDVPAVKRFIQRLVGNKAVGPLRLRGGPDEQDIEPIDLLEDKTSTEFEVRESGRHLDSADCCRKLISAFRDIEPSIRRRLAGGEQPGV
jgi:hypothetical protein